jgi:cephalosporin-C deacetylase
MLSRAFGSPVLLLSSAALALGEPLVPVPTPAAERTSAIRVEVTPDRSDWTYLPGSPVTFRVAVLADRQPIPGLAVTYTLGPEMAPSVSKTAVTPPDGRLELDGGTLAGPGFLRCVVTVELGGQTHQGIATAGFAPEQIAPTQIEPPDFDAFWNAQKQALADVPLDAHITLIPEASTAAINVYHVSVRTLGSWAGLQPPPRLYGILCEPKAPGRYPAILRVPGAGVRPYSGLRGEAERGAITLEIGIHGLPVTLPQETYDQLRTGALDGYWTFNLSDRERYYYRRVILGAIRANDFLTTRPMWDGRNLAVGGESQGGMLAIATAALDPRVTVLHAIVPAFCDLSGPLHGRAGGWPHLLQNPAEGYRTEPIIRTVQYYDTVNFARRVRVPGVYAWGYNDDVCPPTSVFAAYHAIRAPKHLVLALEMGHRTLREVYERVDTWVFEQLGLTSVSKQSH